MREIVQLAAAQRQKAWTAVASVSDDGFQKRRLAAGGDVIDAEASLRVRA
jgi:hypothetical protein